MVPAIAQANELIAQLDEELKDLATLMRYSADQIRIEALYRLPYRGTPTVKDDIQIPVVDATEDPDGLDLAIQALTCIWMSGPQAATESTRAPGIVAMPGHLIERIRATNLLREELQSIVSSIPKKVDRTRLVWRKHYGLSSMQALRQTQILSQPMNCHFFWFKTDSVQRQTAGALLEKCIKDLDELGDGQREPEDHLEGSVGLRLSLLVKALSSLPADEPIAIKRPVQPHPRARILEHGQRSKIKHAPVPFVFDVNEPPVRRITALDSYPSLTVPARTYRALIAPDPIVPWTEYYRYT